jgi:hypothetical protein
MPLPPVTSAICLGYVRNFAWLPSLTATSTQEPVHIECMPRRCPNLFLALVWVMTRIGAFKCLQGVLYDLSCFPSNGCDLVSPRSVTGNTNHSWFTANRQRLIVTWHLTGFVFVMAAVPGRPAWDHWRRESESQHSPCTPRAREGSVGLLGWLLWQPRDQDGLAARPSRSWVR